MIGWDHPATAERYERFCRRHLRYRRADVDDWLEQLAS